MDIDTDQLIWIVTGVQLKAELGDRPLAYRVEAEVRRLLAELLGPPADGEHPRWAPVVISDVYYLNNTEIQDGPVIAVGGPGVNMVSGNFVESLSTAVSIENQLVIQMDIEMTDARCAVWGMDHLSTVQAVELFIVKGYLETFVRGVMKNESA